MSDTTAAQSKVVLAAWGTIAGGVLQIAGGVISAVVFPAFALPGRDFEFAIAIWGVCFVLLGVAMRAEVAINPAES